VGRLSGAARPLLEARLPGDDRGRRPAVLRRILPPLFGAARAGRALLPAGDRDRRPPLRGGEGGAELLQHSDLPGRLPTVGRGDPALCRPPDEHEHDLAGGNRPPPPPHPRALAGTLHRQRRPRRRARLRRALPAALDALAGDERGRVPGAAGARRADAVCEAAAHDWGLGGDVAESDGKTVLVTGGSGYLAGWCIVELLRRGFRVRTTVRNPARER